MAYTHFATEQPVRNGTRQAASNSADSQNSQQPHNQHTGSPERSPAQLGRVGQRVRRISNFLHRRSVSYLIAIIGAGMTTWEIDSAIHGFRSITDLPWITTTLLISGLISGYGVFKGIPHFADDALFAYRQVGKRFESGVLWLHAAFGKGQSD